MIKKVVPIVSPAVNYLTYLQADCGVNWKLEDTENVQGLLSDEDRSFIQSCSADLSFRDGSASSLTSLFYFFPAYVFREDSEGLTDYFTCLLQCHAAQSLSPLFDRYGHHISRLREFNPGFLYNRQFLEQGDVLTRIKLLSAIYKAYYHKYMQYHWDADKALIEITCAYIHKLFAQNDIVGKWEAVTGLELLADRYQLIIVPSLQFGPAQIHCITASISFLPLLNIAPGITLTILYRTRLAPTPSCLTLSVKSNFQKRIPAFSI